MPRTEHLDYPEEFALSSEEADSDLESETTSMRYVSVSGNEESATGKKKQPVGDFLTSNNKRRRNSKSEDEEYTAVKKPMHSFSHSSSTKTWVSKQPAYEIPDLLQFTKRKRLLDEDKPSRNKKQKRAYNEDESLSEIDEDKPSRNKKQKRAYNEDESLSEMTSRYMDPQDLLHDLAKIEETLSEWIKRGPEASKVKRAFSNKKNLPGSLEMGRINCIRKVLDEMDAWLKT